MTYLDLVPPVPLGTSGSSLAPFWTVSWDIFNLLPLEVDPLQILLESSAPRLLGASCFTLAIHLCLYGYPAECIHCMLYIVIYFIWRINRILSCLSGCTISRHSLWMSLGKIIAADNGMRTEIFQYHAIVVLYYRQTLWIPHISTRTPCTISIRPCKLSK